MKKLIYAEDLLAAVRDDPNINGLCFKKLKQHIEEVPDAVKRGRWIEKKVDNFRKWELTCPECGWIGTSNYDAYDEPFDFNYCPICGTRMDGEEDG